MYTCIYIGIHRYVYMYICSIYVYKYAYMYMYVSICKCDYNCVPMCFYNVYIDI